MRVAVLGARIFVVACVISLVAGPQARAEKFVDPLGHIVEWQDPPRRIASLSPSLTEILFAIGFDASTIVGRTRFCDYPPAALAIPQLGGIVDPSIESILVTWPDLVLVTRGNPVELMESCVRLELPLYAIETRGDLERVFATIEEVGAVTGRPEDARRVADELRLRLAAVEEKTRNLPADMRPRVFHGELGDPHWTAGPGSFVDAMITAAGGTNVAAKAPADWSALSLEAIVAEDPQVYLGCFGPEGIEPARRTALEILRDPQWRGTSLGREPRLFLVDEDRISRPGPRVIDVLEEFARYLHPDLWAHPDSSASFDARPSGDRR